MRRLLIVIGGLGLCFFIIAVCQPALSISAGKKITEREILAILKSIDRAILEKDVKGITAHMASDIVVRLSIPGPEGPQILTMSREEYESNLEEGFRAATDYKYMRKDTRIDISSGGEAARVTSKVLETMARNGRIIRSATEEKSVFELRSERILITSIDAVILSLDMEGDKSFDL
jgi:hypothetical protein